MDSVDSMDSVQSILLAVDFTPATDAVLRRVEWLLTSQPVRRVRLVHTVDSRILDGVVQFGLAARGDFEQSARAAAEDSLDELAERLRRRAEVEVDWECRCGNPADELVAAVQALSPDLVIAGAGNGGWRQLVLGSTARRLLNDVNRPLWLVRGDGEAAIEHIVVAADLRAASALGARMAAMLWPQAQFEFVHAVEFLADIAAGLASESGMSRDQLRTQLEEKSRQRLLAFAAATLPGREVATRLENGHPVAIVCRRVRETQPQLVVLGRSGRRGLQAAVLGSVAEALLELIQSDVLLVPPK